MIINGEGWTMRLGRFEEQPWAELAADVNISDLPYEVETHNKARRRLKDATQRKGAPNTGEVRRIDAPIGEDFPALDEATLRAFCEFSSQWVARWTMSFCQGESLRWFRDESQRAGLEYVRGLWWHKPNGTPSFGGDRPASGGEAIALMHPPGRKRWNGRGARGHYSVPLDHRAGGRGKNVHPTRKPDALMDKLVELYTDPGETVVDLTAGSGSTGVACVKAGRKFIGVEMQEKYFHIAVERLRAAEVAAQSAQVPLFAGELLEVGDA